jgi:small subunit ribosomal protein S24e
VDYLVSCDLTLDSLVSKNSTLEIATMSGSVVVRTKKFKKNPLLGRKQMVVDVLHPGRANVPKKELQEVVAGMFKADAKLTSLFGFQTKYGGGKSTGFCLIYDNEEAFRKFEPLHRQVRNGFSTRAEKSRKAIKEAKNKGLKIRGTGASIAKHKAKRSAAAS